MDTNRKNYGTGRRKEASARVWVIPGSGKITVNNKPLNEYFHRLYLLHLVKQPLMATQVHGSWDVICTVKGSGKPSQAGAVRHGISRALKEADESLAPILRAGGFLTRDSRVVERKKYGYKKARKSFQFSKR